MRIAYICADRGVPVFGHKGCSIHVQEVVRALRNLGAHVEVFTPRGDGAPPAGLESLVVHRLPFMPHDVRSVREKQALAANRDLRAALGRTGPFDAIYERYSLWSFAGMETAHAQQIPALLEVNAPLVEEQAEHRGLVHRRAAERIAERVFGGATAMLAVSREVAGYLGRFPAAQGRVHVIPNGVDPTRFLPHRQVRSSRRSETFLVGFVGSLKRWHGLPILIDAFATLYARVQHARLLIMGDGPERAALENDVAARRLSGAVDFTGAAPPQAVATFLAALDVAVAPYPNLPHFYFSPLKVYEYMAAGCAIVASRVGQLQELLQDEANALLCPPGDATSLAAILLRLEKDPALRARLGRAARAAVLHNHTWEQVARRILHLAQAKLVSQRCLEAER
jgi:glycosyltransferase involved in cell wall biosynthesis